VTGFRLATVLRARRAQEDIARVAAARARTDAERAASDIQLRARHLDRRGLPDGASGSAFAAAMWARRSLATALGDAIAAAGAADAVSEERRGELVDAAVRRRALEQLAERHDEAERRAGESAERAVLDELAGTAHQRRRGSR